MAGGSVTIVKPGPELAARASSAAVEAENYVRNVASPACGAFYRMFEELGKSQAVRSATSMDPDWPDFGAHVDRLRKDVEALAKIVAGLDAGTLELVPWMREGDARATPITIGVAKRGQYKEPGGVGFFPLVPIVVVLAVGAVAAGAFVLADLYLSAQNAAEQANLIRAQTEQKMQAAIAASPPEQRDQLVTAFQRAHQVAADTSPSWLTTFGRNLAALATDVVNAAGSLLSNFAESTWPWLLVIALLAGERRRGRRA